MRGLQVKGSMHVQAHFSVLFHHCRFEKFLELPALPEMVFGDNKLTLRHCDGYGITFETLDALKLVNNHCDLLKVADAEEWAKTRYIYVVTAVLACSVIVSQWCDSAQP